MVENIMAIFFPGQGGQKVGMGLELYNNYPEARSLFSLADDVLGFRLSSLMFNGPEEILNKTEFAQPAIYTYSQALKTVLENQGLIEGSRLSFVAGHSLGELNAFLAAGSYTFEDGLVLVRKRGELTQEACELFPSGMVALKLGKEEPAAVEEALAYFGLDTVLVNSPDQLVFGGLNENLERAKQHFAGKGMRFTQLNISGAFHSRVMGSAQELFAKYVEKTAITDPVVPVISNSTTAEIRQKNEVSNELVSQLTEPVRWVDTIVYLVSRGVENFVEIGENPTLTNFARKILRDRKIETSDIKTAQGATLATLSRMDINSYAASERSAA